MLNALYSTDENKFTISLFKLQSCSLNFLYVLGGNYRIRFKTLIVDIQQMNPRGKDYHFDKRQAPPEDRNGNGPHKQPSISGCHLCLGQRRRRLTVLPQWRCGEEKRSETHRGTSCPSSAGVLAGREVWWGLVVCTCIQLAAKAKCLQASQTTSMLQHQEDDKLLWALVSITSLVSIC